MTDHPVLNTLNRVLLAGLAAVTAGSFFVVPLDQSLPIHWDVIGNADAYAPAGWALLLPMGLSLFTVVLMAVLRRSGLKKDFEAGRHLIHATISLMIGLSFVIAAVTIASGLGQVVDVPRVLAFAIGVLFVVLGNYTPKTQQNWVAGIRLPWTLKDADNWRVTHRWAGRLMMIAGLAIIGAGVINLSGAYLVAIILGSIVLALGISVAISYTMARNKAA